MTDRPIEMLRRIYERWASGDFSVVEFDDHAVLILRPEFPDAGVYVGPDSIREYTLGLLEPWERLTITGEEFLPVGDSVLVRVRQKAIGRGSGVPAEMTYFMAWTFRAGRAIRLESIRDEADARRAVGLGP